MGKFDVRPYLADEAFEDLRRPNGFEKVVNGGYFVEWDVGPMSRRTQSEARWRVIHQATTQELACRATP